jgi:tetratricopeptide (TPR) repeat protein
MSKKNSLFILSTILSLIIISGCSDGDSRKIKLAASGDVVQIAGQAGTSVLKVTPEEQKSLLIRYFVNHTGDPSLNWLERGLTDMLITELSQSPYLNIVSESHFLDAARRMGKSSRELENRIDEIRVAQNLGVQLLITGHISYHQKKLRIEIEVTDAQSGAEKKKERVEGASLEKLFSMVDELSGKLRMFLREKGQQDQFASIKPSEMTGSLEAFRCYSKALENREKYLYADAEACLEEALLHDSAFAAVYLELMDVKRALKKSVDVKEYLAKSKKHIDRLSYADQVKIELIESELEGDYYKIFAILENAVMRSPMDTELRFTLAQQYRMWGHEAEAMQEYEQLLDMAPEHKLAYNDLGYLYADMGDFKTALYMLDKYQQLAPDEPNPHDSKGEILLFAGRLREAAEEYKKALEIMPGYYNSAFQLSDIYMELGDKKKAFKYLSEGLQYVPDTGFEKGADFRRARIYWRFGNIAEADKYALKILDRQPLMSGVLIRRIEMYRSAGKEEQAKKMELESLQAFRKYVESPKEKDMDVAKHFLEFVTYSDFPLETIMPMIGKYVVHSKSSLDELNKGLLTAMYKLYQGQPEEAIASFEEHMPLLVSRLTLRKNEIGWGSTWKNLFRFFDEDKARDEFSQIFSEYISDLAAKEERKDLEFIANMARVRALGRENNNEKYHQVYTKYGVPTEEKWKICGPFRDFSHSGFEHAFPPENDQKLTSVYKNNGRQIRWIDGEDEHIDGHFNLLDIFPQNSFATAYAMIYIHSPDKRNVQIRMGSDEACKFWLNDKLIWQHYLKRAAVVDRDIMTVVLHPGYNKMMLKVTNTDLDWGFYFRVTDEFGDGFPDLRFVSPADLESSLASKLINK